MRKYRKVIIIIIILMAALLVAVTGLMSPGVTQTRECSLIYIPKIKDDTNDFWSSLISGCKMAAEEYGSKLEIMAPDKEENIEEQNRLLKAAIEKEPDAILFSPSSMSASDKLLKKAKEKGITINFGSEFEFYLFKQDENGNNTFVPLDQGGYMDIAPLDKGENIRREICLTLSEMGIDPEVSHHEMGPGQNEIDFRYSQALQAADNAATFKWVVEALANMQGLVADFSPKPIEDAPGNGMHINMSVQSHEELLMPFMAGILHHIEEMTLFLNPSKDSYKRMGKDKAPSFISWSYQNRNQLIRIPATHSSNRMELRSPDCSCNIYLAYALLIYAGLEGIEKNMIPDPCTDVVSVDTKRLPQSLKEAKVKALNSDWLKQVLGKDVVDIYVG